MEQKEMMGVSPGIEEVAKNTPSAGVQPEVTAAIGISISTSPDLDRLGFTNLHVQDAMVELARYLLVANCKLVYAGDLRKKGYSYLLSELASQYTQPKTSMEFRVVNYFAWPIHLQYSIEDEILFKVSKIHPEKLEAPAGTPNPNVYLEPDTKEARVIWAKSLSYMREKITNATQARVLIGGQVTGYGGRIPGVVEEALLTIQLKRPLYLCGAFGGATGAIIEAIRSGNSPVLDEAFQCRQADYKEFFDHWNSTEPDPIDYVAVNRKFQELGLKGLAELNGLTEEENVRLFETPHIPEMIFLILKGLNAKEVLK